MALGVNKGLEPMACLARRRGWDVTITRRNHVRWTSPDGRVLRSGLTMSSATARNFQRTLARALEQGSPAAG